MSVRVHIVWFCLLFCLCGPIAFVWAQDADSDFTPPPGEPLKWISIVLKTTFWLGIIIVAIFVTIWVLRRFVTPTQSFHTIRPVRLLFQESLAPGKSVCLIRVVDQVHVIGVTNTQISYIATLDDDEINQIDQWLGSSRTDAGGSGGSSGLKSMEKIQQLIQQFGKRS